MKAVNLESTINQRCSGKEFIFFARQFLKFDNGSLTQLFISSREFTLSKVIDLAGHSMGVRLGTGVFIEASAGSEVGASRLFSIKAVGVLFTGRFLGTGYQQKDTNQQAVAESRRGKCQFSKVTFRPTGEPLTFTKIAALGCRCWIASQVQNRF